MAPMCNKALYLDMTPRAFDACVFAPPLLVASVAISPQKDSSLYSMWFFGLPTKKDWYSCNSCIMCNFVLILHAYLGPVLSASCSQAW